MDLKPCPFCGYEKPVTWGKRTQVGYTGMDYTVYRVVYSVRCPRCNARGATAGGKVVHARPEHMPSWAVLERDLFAKAQELWNNRKEMK